MSPKPQSTSRKPSNRFRSRSLRSAAIAVSATTVGTTLAGDADAAIISDLGNSHAVGETFSLDGTAFSEIELVARGMGGMFDLFLEAPAAMMGMGDSSTVEFAFFTTGGMMAAEYLDALGGPDTVDGSLSFTDLAYLVEDGTDNPDFAPGTTAYAGFVFDPSGTLPLYGWARVQFDASGVDFTIDQWAYDDTGAALSVGVVPEPATSLLIGLGLTGLAVAARYLRRPDESDTTARSAHP